MSECKYDNKYSMWVISFIAVCAILLLWNGSCFTNKILDKLDELHAPDTIFVVDTVVVQPYFNISYKKKTEFNWSDFGVFFYSTKFQDTFVNADTNSISKVMTTCSDWSSRPIDTTKRGPYSGYELPVNMRFVNGWWLPVVEGE